VVARNDSHNAGLLSILDRIEQIFTSPVNPEQELPLGLFRLRIPAFPVEVVREAVLNAVTHRDYMDPGEVLVRHTADQLAVTSPGGFIAGITPRNILRHEPVSRNRTLAEAFEKLRLVERAGIGRRRIFETTLSYGKRIPEYEADGWVTLRIFDGGFDERMATLVARWRGEGREIGLDGLLILSYLRESAFIDAGEASELLQLSREGARTVLDQLSQPETGFLERQGRTKSATFHLSKGTAKDLLGRASYTRIRGLNPLRYSELVREFAADHGSISPRECRQLLGLGESPSARVETSRYLKRWSGDAGFLLREGGGKHVRYVAR
jgi:ATP-dependent DNA helicase RecG